MEIRPAPGAPPVHMKAVSTNRRIGGGRWLVLDYRTDGGFEGHGVYGWDAGTGKYTGVWVDTAQSAMARSEGTWDAAAGTMTFRTDASHQGRAVRYSEITQTLPDGTRLYRNVVPTPDGGEFEMIRATYRRRAR